jgi:hypothetical protein
VRPIGLTWRHVFVVLGLVLALAPTAAGQVGSGKADVVPKAELIERGEVNRLFDAYAIMQAQEMLRLDDAKFGSFVTRLKALQEARRRNVRARGQIIRDLQRLLRQTDGAPDEAALKERVDALARQDAAASVEIKKAAEAVDALLDVRQQARFRVFEYQLELKRLELLARARQQMRANRARPGGSP